MKGEIATWMHSLPPTVVAATTRLAGLPHGMDEYRFELQSTRSWTREQFAAEETQLFLGTSRPMPVSVPTM